MSTGPDKGERYRSLSLMALCGLFLASIGCEESVDPIIGTDIPYTVWGFMNAGADTQRVRIFPISDELLPDGSHGIDAQVTSTDLTTSEQRTWTYQAVVFDSLTTGHLFWSPFRAEHGHRYRLEVVRSDGATSSVEVMVPPPATFEIEMEEEGGTTIPIRIGGEVPNLVGLRVTYQASNLPPSNVWPSNQGVHPPVHHPVTVSYDALVQRNGDVWEAVLNMQRDFEVVKFVYQANCLITQEGGSAPDIWLRTMEVSAVAADSTWSPPGGVFDPNILALPGTFSNVENGYGFFGAGQGIRQTWEPTIQTRLNAGYNFNPQCTFTATDTPQCRNPPVPCLGENARSIWEIWLR